MLLFAAGGAPPPLFTVIPFALLLLSIAILPLVAHHWWESNRNKGIIAGACGLPIAFYVLAAVDWHPLVHTGMEYLAFIALLGSLFVISGGIYVRGAFAGTPLVNTVFLGIGAVLASFLGTTGASMVLIRPLLRANKKRRHKMHIIVFFIFIVSNLGGCLTPLGDPPLFLGFLKGVPFAWTFNLFFPWLLVNGVLLLVFNFLDQYKFDKEDVETKGSLVEDVQPKRGIGIDGKINVLFLAGVVAVIFCSGTYIYPWAKEMYSIKEHAEHPEPAPEAPAPTAPDKAAPDGAKEEGGHHSMAPDLISMGVQVVLMTLLAALSLGFTKKEIREQNEFNWHPIIEVAVLFAGIFAAMIPALLILQAKGSSLPLTAEWHYFWLTGVLSSFLDNAPTYLVFLALGQGAHLIPTGAALADVTGNNIFLKAISCGAVFMGANTYIGNGPNFMVKAIAEQAKISMPSFFGYMLWSLIFLVPLHIIVTVVFFI